MTRMQVLVTAPPLCDAVDVTLAHGLWQRHRACRINRCVWKAAAYQTLVLSGRLVPQSMSPRERAAARGLDYPRAPQSDTPPHNGHSPATLREVLDRLEALARDPYDAVSVRTRQLTTRAGRAGYRLERASGVPDHWMLLDAEDSAHVYSATDLDQIERWLDD
ncbi:hypothetical protein ACW2Q0_03685 [Nocardia sp. R16R-3T]